MSIGSIFKAIAGFFTSGKAQRALAEVEKLMPLVLPIVDEIGKATPNRTDDELIAAFRQYGVPFISQYAQNPPDALRTLAQVVVGRTVPQAAQSVVNAAIELAVVAVKK